MLQVCTWMRDAPAGSRESRGGCPAATTDQAGQFRIDHVAMGTTGVEAIKPEDGYVAFAGTSVSEVVTLTPNQRSATVVLKLGPKAGRLIPTHPYWFITIDWPERGRTHLAVPTAANPDIGAPMPPSQAFAK